MKYPDINKLNKINELENEEWRPVVGWENFYSVSNLGRVKREVRAVTHSNQVESFSMTYPEKVLKANPDSRGYPQVTLNAKHFGRKRRVARVHRLVAEAFLGNPEGKPQVNHMDSDTMNANVNNLEWCTASENQKHSWDNDRQERRLGEDNAVSKYSDSLVRVVYKLAKSKAWSQEKIGELYGMPQITVSNILTKKTWRHITDLIDKQIH